MSEHGVCVICHRRPGVHWHHRKLRRHPGTDVPENILDVCGYCHDWIHKHPEEAYARGLLLHSYDEITEWTQEKHEHLWQCEICEERKPPKPKPEPREGPVPTVSFKAPQHDPEAAQRIKEKVAILLENFEEAGHEIGRTVTVERALDYTLLNAGPEDYGQA